MKIIKMEEYLGPNQLFKKDELVRIIASALDELGFHCSATLLKEEARTEPISPEFYELQCNIRDGYWTNSVYDLEEIQYCFKKTVDQHTINQCLRSILKQCIRECLAADNLTRALKVLNGNYEEFLGVPKSAIDGIFPAEVVEEMTPEEIAIGREEVVEKLRDLLPPDVVVPRNRFWDLLKPEKQGYYCPVHPVEDGNSFCECPDRNRVEREMRWRSYLTGEFLPETLTEEEEERRRIQEYRRIGCIPMIRLYPVHRQHLYGYNQNQEQNQ